MEPDVRSSPADVLVVSVIDDRHGRACVIISLMFNQSLSWFFYGSLTHSRAHARTHANTVHATRNKKQETKSTSKL